MAKSMFRVLVVDDFESLRRFVVSQLGTRPELQIIGEASNGLDAVQKAEELQPDLILMDIGLPGLNGIEAARRIKKASPHCKILFISQDSSVETVEAALETGAAGYVVKSDAGRELLTAVSAVLRGEQFLGRRFAPHNIALAQNGNFLRAADTMKTDARFREYLARLAPQEKNGDSRHEVHFYSQEVSLQNRLADFSGSALKAGNAAIVVATRPLCKELLLRLEARGLDVDAAKERGTFILLDATEALSTFVVDGIADSGRFQELLSNLIVTASGACEKQQPRVAVYGEFVQLLWAQGNAEAAIQLEKVGNQLLKSYEIDILCGYSLTNFHDQPGTDIFQRVCAEHSAVYCG